MMKVLLLLYNYLKMFSHETTKNHTRKIVLTNLASQSSAINFHGAKCK